MCLGNILGSNNNLGTKTTEVSLSKRGNNSNPYLVRASLRHCSPDCLQSAPPDYRFPFTEKS